eukprot:TRINITY_DN2194_c0_g1_i2.p1 TRINITY_DN2194_c0_g1~~TRINITY_DN2194_c0_g1_i2.p1  ORF type:complete len:225 (+),score=31.45 TRINITY_DN2194_c0_g1_i2:483-1157(+)
MGFTTYFILRNSNTNTTPLRRRPISPKAGFSIENEFYRITFSSDTNQISSILDKNTNKSLAVSQNYLWYQPQPEFDDPYNFRPVGPAKSITTKPTAQVFTSSLVSEVVQQYSPWLSHTIRLYKGQRVLQIEAEVGPIDVSDGIGKEIISRYSTGLNTNKTWWTDSNGDEMQERIFDYRPTWNLTIDEPIAINYCPVNLLTFIKDDNLDMQLTYSHLFFPFLALL